MGVFDFIFFRYKRIFYLIVNYSIKFPNLSMTLVSGHRYGYSSLSDYMTKL